jgi:hypothetical protein
VSQIAVYGAEVSVPIAVHEDVPAGALSKTTCCTLLSASEADALSPTFVPPTGVPGSVSETVGPLKSTFAVAVAAVEVLPTLSLMVKV